MTIASTKRQVVADALATMGVTGAGEEASNADAAYLNRIYDIKHAEWSGRGYVYWPNTGDNVAEIPYDVHFVVRDLLINQSANAFGKAQTPISQIAAVEEILLKQLRRHMARNPSGFPTKVDTF